MPISPVVGGSNHPCRTASVPLMQMQGAKLYWVVSRTHATASVLPPPQQEYQSQITCTHYSHVALQQPLKRTCRPHHHNRTAQDGPTTQPWMLVTTAAPSSMPPGSNAASRYQGAAQHSVPGGLTGQAPSGEECCCSVSETPAQQLTSPKSD
jgi:hypothetical protein